MAFHILTSLKWNFICDKVPIQRLIQISNWGIVETLPLISCAIQILSSNFDYVFILFFLDRQNDMIQKYVPLLL